MGYQSNGFTELRDEIGQVGDVVNEVVVPAGTDPLGVAVSAPVEGEDVKPRIGKERRNEIPSVGVLEKPMQQKHRVVAASPFEEVQP